MIDVGAYRGSSSKFDINRWGDIIAFKTFKMQKISMHKLKKL